MSHTGPSPHPRTREMMGTGMEPPGAGSVDQSPGRLPQALAHRIAPIALLPGPGQPQKPQGLPRSLADQQRVFKEYQIGSRFLGSNQVSGVWGE